MQSATQTQDMSVYKLYIPHFLSQTGQKWYEYVWKGVYAKCQLLITLQLNVIKYDKQTNMFNQESLSYRWWELIRKFWDWFFLWTKLQVKTVNPIYAFKGYLSLTAHSGYHDTVIHWSISDFFTTKDNYYFTEYISYDLYSWVNCIIILL
jgi:hypothetical protein